MSSQSPPSIHYEVYTQDGNRWNLHARYERNEREAALNDAKNVERTLQIPAKVVRETYYPGNNHSEETLVYAGDGALRAKALARAQATPKYRGGGGGGGGGGVSGAGQALKETIAADPVGSFGAAGKLTLVVVAALTIAGIATSLMNVALDPLAGQISEAADSLILFGTFMVTFVGTALPLSTSLLNRRLFGGGGSAKAAPKKSVPPPMPKAAKEATPVDEIEAEEELDWEDLKDEDEALPPIDEDGPEDATAETQETAETSYLDAAQSAGESGPAIFARFVNALIAAVRKIRPVLDAYNLFGIDLVMAGAIDLLGQQKEMDGEERRTVLRNAIEAMGVKAATAQAFADKYESYLGEQRYMPMILSGRSAMEGFLGGHDMTLSSVGPVFELWNRPQSQAPATASRIMTVMFTDMVGSTDMTQAQGDKAAQNVVRRHNAIVRNALAQYSGKEIKHTGDGIMASFGSAANGVEAAVAIQRAIATSNGSQPGQPLHVRIGINAGEPIEEEEDLFGSTVQLAARVCARCDTDGILCTNVVKELSTGRGLNFNSIGPQALKGFKDQIMLFEVSWRE